MVGVSPTRVPLHLRVVWWLLAPREMFGYNLNQGKLPYFDLRISQNLGLVLGGNYREFGSESFR